MNRAALRTRTIQAALGVVVGLVVLAIVAPLVTPYLPDGIDLANRRAAPSWDHLFGTDELGRDVYTRTLFGARVSLAIGLLSAAVVGVLGMAIGAVSGYAGGWIDDVLMTEKTRYFRGTEPPDSGIWNQQIYRVRVFDELIYNTDRNLGNLVITNDWKLWMIDHTRAFRLHKKVGNRKQLVRCDRKLLEAMRNLDSEDVSRELKSSLRTSEIKALLARRDEIVSYFDQQAMTRGDSAVLYDYSGP